MSNLAQIQLKREKNSLRFSQYFCFYFISSVDGFLSSMCFGCQMVFSPINTFLYWSTNKQTNLHVEEKNIYITKRKMFIILPPFRKKRISLLGKEQLNLDFNCKNKFKALFKPYDWYTLWCQWIHSSAVFFGWRK